MVGGLEVTSNRPMHPDDPTGPPLIGSRASRPEEVQGTVMPREKRTR